jgi:hypothetical protein
MPATQIEDPVLVRFRQELGEAYGSKLERVVLFGSRARGGAVINALPFHAGGYQKRTGFMAELRRDGVDL